MFEIHNNSEVYCWLKQQLEPRYSVVSSPNADYFSQWSYCYQVFDGPHLIKEFAGDFRNLQPGQLVRDAVNLVASLAPAGRRPHTGTTTDSYPVASRLPPARTNTTWFSSGRAAFAWLIGEEIQPRRIHLPTLICWSLVDVLRSRFPQIELAFFPVNRHLQPRFPVHFERDDALLFVHYFGYLSTEPAVPNGTTLLEDCSHLVSSFQPVSEGYAFGSLRKIYRTADGGYVRGGFNPVYEPNRKLDAWLRCEASDWRDLREAENMTDRHWSISDISSQSLAAVMNCDDQTVGSQRRQNESILARNLTVGSPVREYTNNECPLLHNRYLPTTSDRDSLKRFLAARQIYCSIHWPVHPLLMERQDQTDITEATWIQDHVLSIPVSHEYGPAEMDAICTACDEWARAGSARFGSSAA